MDDSNKVPEGEYEGYYWMSDADEPVVSRGGMSAGEINALLEDKEANPFVVEGLMFCRASGVSVSIRYVDGEYVVKTFKTSGSIADVKAGRYDSISLKRFHAHRMPGMRLVFFQYWRDVVDPLCAGMSVLQPAEMAFVGFEPIN